MTPATIMPATIMSESALLDIQALLKRTIGLEIGLLGDTAIESALRQRLSVLGIAELAVYRALLDASPEELQTLIDRMVVPETWFFRDQPLFRALAGLLPRFAGRSLRLLSIPCATGEEPYSIAMTLLDAGWPAERFCIDAIDVSTAALAQAERALYRRNSFREPDLDHFDGYFEPDGDSRRPVAAVRRQVRFAQGNLLDPELFTRRGGYDVIFCRNALIYFDRATQQQVLHRLKSGLLPGGLLFVGASEQHLAMACDFTAVKLPRAFAFQAGASPAKPAARPATRPRAKAPLRRPAAPAAEIALPAPPCLGPEQPPSAGDPTAGAQILAGQGRFEEAIALCNALLRHREPDVGLLHLLGVIHDAAGNLAAAEDYYRKALYLDPTHRESLAHLSLLLHRNHDARARTMDARLARLSRQEPSR